MSAGDIAEIVGLLACALGVAWISYRLGIDEGEQAVRTGMRGILEKSCATEDGLRAELAAAHEATDELRKKLKDTEQRLAVVGTAWNQALEERDQARAYPQEYGQKLADFQRRVAQAEQQIRIERKHYEEKVAQRRAVHEMEMEQVKERHNTYVNALEQQVKNNLVQQASDVEKVLFTRGRGITHEWRRKKLLALCADVRKRWSKA